MAEQLGIAVASLERWRARQRSPDLAGKVGRPEKIPASARWQLRRCYLDHYKQWGPHVLCNWARRSGLGCWSPTTIAAVIADLRDQEEPARAPQRYEITATNVMWSEDGTSEFSTSTGIFCTSTRHNGRGRVRLGN